MERQHAAQGPEPQPASETPAPHRTSESIVQRPPIEQPEVPARRAGSVEIAPDRRDHAQPPRFTAEIDIQLRTLLAHVDRNLSLYRAASTQPDRDGALEAIDVRVAVALRHVPATLHAQFRDELRALLGRRGFAQLERVLADGEGSYGARAAASLGVDREHVRARGALQLDAEGDAPELADDDARAIAEHGLGGGGGTLPFLTEVQQSFGHHDVSDVRAHVGGPAREAASALGARAYASGDAVAFAAAPDLHLAAHEAAHVVQQRGGVRLSGGVGAAGDTYERHADAVADLVVRGDSAQALLDQHAHRGATGGRAVQRVAAPRARVRAAILALTSLGVVENLVAQLGALQPGRTELTHEFTLAFGDATHVIRGADVRPLLAVARQRRQELAPLPAAPTVDDPEAATRAVLQSAVHRSRDIAELDAARASILAVRESRPESLHITLAGLPYVVGVADITWLLDVVEHHLADARSVGGALVDPAMSAPVTEPQSAPPATAPASVPGATRSIAAEPEGSDAAISSSYRQGFQIPIERRFQTRYGELRIELVAEVQLLEIETTPGTPADVPLEASARPGGQASVSARGVIQALVERVIGTHLAGVQDRLQFEQRPDGPRLSLGLDFGPIVIHDFELSFAITVAQLDAASGLSFGPSLSATASTPWAPLGDALRQGLGPAIADRAHILDDDDVRCRLRLRGALTPNWPAITIAASRAALPVIDAVSAVATDVGAAAAIALPLVAPVLIIGVLFASAVDHELARRGEEERARERAATPSDRTLFARLGAEIHDRTRRFCRGYTDEMRQGVPRAVGAGTEQGHASARTWIEHLRASGHSRDAIRAAAQSAGDLDQQVLEASRADLQRQIDALVPPSVGRFFHGHEPQMLEWATQYLRRCLSLDELPPVLPTFTYDPCASPMHYGAGLRPHDDRGEAFDPSACAPGASDPDAPVEGVQDDATRTSHPD
ncbi:MAG: DUF4157 domain-containing protein [Deltaproteobacteria bacterium]